MNVVCLSIFVREQMILAKTIGLTIVRTNGIHMVSY